jgi:ribonuclease-3
LNFKFTDAQLKDLLELLDCPIQNRSLFEEAFLHPSCTYLRPKASVRNYQRLEFLGDRVLGLIISEELLKRFPQEDEGKIARRFTALVCMDVLAAIAQRLDLHRFLFVLPGIEDNLKNSASSIADAIEALIAALYLDGGLDNAKRFILRHWGDYIAGHLTPPKDPKSALQEWVQAQGFPLPVYSLEESKGPLHNPIFVVKVQGMGFEPAFGEGNSKKVAEHKAAQEVLKKILESNS